MENQNSCKLLIDLHIKFLRQFLFQAPKNFVFYEYTRPTILFFMISGLDILNALNVLSSEEKLGICDWIYSQQVKLKPGLENDIEELRKCGFYGSRTSTVKDCDNENLSQLNVGNLAMTYSSLCTLIILGDDLSRVNRINTLKAVKYLQNENGSFLSSVVCGENDMRFVYCAMVICYILNGFSYINIEKTIQFISQSVHYDGGIGLKPNLEAHGGSSFCGIASLFLMDQLETALTSIQMKNLKRWLIFRQQSGFQGRPNKDVDTCYSFWIGATLKIMGMFSYVNWEENKNSILLCQNTITGGFSKCSHTEVDLLHTYFGLYGLSFMNITGLNEMHSALNISMRAYEHLKVLHNLYKTNSYW